MSFDTIEVADLKGWKFDQVVASCRGKTLIVKVWPAENMMEFHLSVNKEVVGIYRNIEDACQGFNNL